MKIKNIALIISGDPDIFSLQHRVFNITAAAAVLAALVAGIENSWLGLSPWLIALCFIYMLLMMLIYYLSRFKNLLGPCVTLACLLLIFFFTPAGWLLNGGTMGGAHYTIMFYGLVICAVCSDWKRNFFIILLILMVAGLGIFEYLHPEQLHYYDQGLIRYIDVISSMLITIAITILLFLVYSKNYDRERTRVLQYSMLLEEMAITDGLTGLFNHSYIYKLLEDTMFDNRRNGSGLSIIMFDLDYFKNINDAFGHEFGNKVLVKVAHSLKTNIRNSDLLGRYGGEEFLVICPGTGLHEASKLAERLIIEVDKLILGDDIRVTLSGGVAELNRDTDSTVISLIEKADDALYQAKRMGRNRLAVYNNARGQLPFEQKHVYPNSTL